MRGLIIGASLLVSTVAVAADSAQARLSESASVFSEIMATPDKGIPQDLLSRANCVVILPNVKKAAFLVGGEYGKGFAMCRKESGAGWSAPAAMKIEGGSFGAQIGGASTDLVLLVMNRKGMEKLLSDKFTLGADASVAAGPVGRSASAATDVKLDAEILSWSRSKGLFAGLALNGATLRPDNSDNEQLYGSKMANRDILMGDTKSPDAAQQLTAALDRYSHREGSASREKDHR